MGALVGGVVGIRKADRQDACPTLGRDLRQAVQVVVCFSRGHAGGAALLEDNIAHEHGIGKVSVGGGIGGVGDSGKG